MLNHKRQIISEILFIIFILKFASWENFKVSFSASAADGELTAAGSFTVKVGPAASAAFEGKYPKVKILKFTMIYNQNDKNHNQYQMIREFLKKMLPSVLIWKRCRNSLSPPRQKPESRIFGQPLKPLIHENTTESPLNGESRISVNFSKNWPMLRKTTKNQLPSQLNSTTPFAATLETKSFSTSTPLTRPWTASGHSMEKRYKYVLK